MPCIRKAYNTKKDLISTPLKNHSTFDDASFEALGYCNEQQSTTGWYRHERLTPAFVDPYAPSDVAINKE